jgi:predicted nuclease of predicted toxin-antitoxin system
MRLLVDMNLTPRWVQELGAAGHEALHWSVAGPAAASDPAVLPTKISALMLGSMVSSF